ncbi:gamma-glutamylcyclotransferase [Candidatus Pacearchaeota archaeon]|nr:gamma-glutamylcyclotransferase [Candidatus Pacearchaeota archaeon]
MNVFVYGTLRKGQRLHCVISNYIENINDGYIRGAKMYDLTGGSYPHVTLTKNNRDYIRGELIEFKSEYEIDAFKRMDIIELPAGYKREIVEVFFYTPNDSTNNDELKTIDAAIYVINDIDRLISCDKSTRIVECGDWIKYKCDIRKPKKS